VITPPSTLYEFWKISPLDVLIFIIGLSITIFESIEHGIFAMIGLSLAILLFRLFKAKGAFLGRIKIRTVHHSKGYSDAAGDDDDARACFLPLDRRDGSNPDIPLERPYPGIFIYRFTEGFNFPNANHHLDYMVNVITAETRPTTVTTFTKLGDRPWNDTTPRHGKEESLDDRPTLKAVILDFSSVNNLDLTSVQTLLDVRSLLDRHSAPRAVQWHFAAIQNRWAKRALAAVGFGLPSFETEDGRPRVFRPVYSLAEMESAEESFAPDHVRDFAVPTSSKTAGPKAGGPKVGGVLDDVELGDMTTQAEKIGEVERVESRRQVPGGRLDEREARLAALHGINRPFFHPDVQSALTSAIATEKLYEATGAESPSRGIVERREVDGGEK
jgi:sodium-independent sulfate anion transporter 11